MCLKQHWCIGGFVLTGEACTSRTCTGEESETKAGRQVLVRFDCTRAFLNTELPAGSICCCWMSLFKIY